MDKFYVNAIMKWIWENLNCKKCKAKITLDKIDLISKSNNKADFEVICQNCETSMKLTAEVSPISEKENKEKKPVEKKWNVNVQDTIINEDEVEIISKKLKWLSSFKWLLSLFFVFMIFSWCEKTQEITNEALVPVSENTEIKITSEKSGKELEEMDKILDEADKLHNAPSKALNILSEIIEDKEVWSWGVLN